MATYNETVNGNARTFRLAEHSLYGSNRLGTRNSNSIIGYNLNGQSSTTSGMVTSVEDIQNRGLKSYELSNHLGNVLAVVSDRKFPVDDGVYNASGVKTSGTADGICDYFYPELTSATDYYAFGAPMPGRQFNSGSYRYGYHGAEKTDEISGNGNHYDYPERGYDPRLVRWWSVDKYSTKYPNQSPYAYVGNSPLINKENDGNDYGVYVDHTTKTIIIKATLNTPKGDKPSSDEAKQSAEFWNGQSSKFQYRVALDDGSYAFYDVKFDIKVTESEDVSQYAKQSNSGAIDWATGKEDPPTYSKGGTQEDNSFRVLDKNDPFFSQQAKTTAKADNRGGVTINETDAAVKDLYAGGDAGPHEVGHQLGAGHVPNTIQSPSLDGTKRQINANVVRNVLGNAGLGKTYSEKATPGTGKVMDQKGMTPSNFNKGTVHEK